MVICCLTMGLENEQIQATLIFLLISMTISFFLPDYPPKLHHLECS